MNGPFGAPAPRWFTIPAHRPFLEDLAEGLWRALADKGGGALAEAVILLPTRRAGRALAEAFLSVAGASAVLLPQIRALGDLDEGEPPFEPGDLALDLPPAIGEARRRFELAALVATHQGLLERTLDAGAALEMADALAAFLDACHLEEVGDADAVDALADGELARHWQVSARFLRLALEAWPRRLEALGLVDPAARRVALLRRLARRWRTDPPAGVLVAAGSTGSAPAAADLLAAIAAAPAGAVVLPGLDKGLAEDAWREVGEAHPQGALRRLLDRAGVERAQVRDWDPAAEARSAGRWRRRLVNEALRPPEATADWLEQIASLRREGAAVGADPFAEGLAGLTLLAAADEEEAALAAALLLRESLETPNATAALVTPDAVLARRVSARLRRWNIAADSSAGAPLANQGAAILAALVARAAIDPTDPVTLLAIVKHPLTRLGLAEAPLEAARRTLERRALRGARPRDWGEIEARLRAAAGSEDALALAARLGAALDRAAAPWATAGEAAPDAAARALAGALEALAEGPAGGAGPVWEGPAGERLAGLIAELIADGGALPGATARGFRDLLDALMAADIVRAGGASHPRLQILGVLEARLIRADRLILAGLEEGVWPRAAPADPFLSRPMRAQLGLPSPERRIGLAAHDLAQAACAPKVVLVTCERRDGAPAVASRWLWRLTTLARGARTEIPGRPDILALARTLDAPLADPPPELLTAPRPAPTPPASARPRRLPVTDVERWVRDPYSLYARRILGLRPLERPDEPMEARARGTAIHKALERLVRAHPEALPEGAEALFAALVLEELQLAGMPPARMTRERALAGNLAPWVIGFEKRRRPGARLLVEQEGALTFDAPGGPFTLTARADRLEARQGAVDILDFKTGAAPTARQVKRGFAPQLTLTAAILAGGGFPDLGPAAPGELLYVRVSGGRLPGREIPAHGDGEAAALAAAALEQLKGGIARFDDPATPYPSWVAPQFRRAYGGDHDHLARLWEWHVIGEDAGASAE